MLLLAAAKLCLVAGRGDRWRLFELVAGWELVKEWVVWVVGGFCPEQVTPAAVELGKRFHVLVRDLPVKQLDVGDNTGRCFGLGDDRDASLQAPLEHDLANVLAVLGGEGGDVCILQRDGAGRRRGGCQVGVARAERRERLEGNAEEAAVVDQVLLLQVWVALVLQGRDRDFCNGMDFANLLLGKVGQANRLAEATLDKLLHGLPRLDVVRLRVGAEVAVVVDWEHWVGLPWASVCASEPGGAKLARRWHGHWPVDDEVVNVVHLQVGERLLEVCFDVLRPVVGVPQLALDEELFTSADAFGDALRDALTDFVLVVVVVGGVNVSVSGLDGGDDGVLGLAGTW